MARLVKSLLQNGPGVSGHRTHRTKKGMKRNYRSTQIARENRTRKLSKFIRKEEKMEAHG